MAKKVTAAPTTEPIRQFVRRFEKLRYNHNAFTAYSDFLALSALQISNAVNPVKERIEQVKRIVSHYSGDELATLTEMFGCIIQEMEPAAGTVPRYYDVLGELFGGLELHDAWKGQFFTPQPVSDFMALCSIGDFEEKIEKRGYISILEPCIGGGANVIGNVNAMFQKGYNPCKQLLVTGYDLDERCIHMSYIQLSLMGIPAMIQQRNSLTLQTYGDYWFTPVFVLDDWAGRLRFERTAAAVLAFIKGTGTNPPSAETLKTDNAAEVTKPEPPAPKQFEQLTLF